jgi:sarcosine/dimethylglycine N-methyltransferase
MTTKIRTDRSVQAEQSVKNAIQHYDGSADDIYRNVWGSSMHLGLFTTRDDTLPVAMQRAKDTMIDGIYLTPDSRVLEVGCGYGTLARQLARKFNCSILATNISQKQLKRAIEMTEQENLSEKVSFEKCDYHKLPYKDDQFDVYWSQESFMHAGDRDRVLAEAHRVLEPFGLLAFSEITLRRSTPVSLRNDIKRRVHTPSMWSKHDYEVHLAQNAFQVQKWEDWSEHSIQTYAWALKQLERKEDFLAKRIGKEAYQKAKAGMALWKKAAEDGYLGWIHVIAAATPKI